MVGYVQLVHILPFLDAALGKENMPGEASRWFWWSALTVSHLASLPSTRDTWQKMKTHLSRIAKGSRGKLCSFSRRLPIFEPTLDRGNIPSEA